MIQHKISFGDKVLEISLPDKEQRSEFIFGKEKEIPSAVDVKDKSIYDKQDSHYFISKIWGWKSKFIGRVYGSLKFTASVHTTEDAKLQTINDLKVALKKRNEIIHEEMIGNYIDGVPVVVLPNKYDDIKINGTEFVYYTITYLSKPPTPHYVARLSETHYLKLKFNYIPNSGESESDWRAAAKNIETSIIQSIRLRDQGL